METNPETAHDGWGERFLQPGSFKSFEKQLSADFCKKLLDAGFGWVYVPRIVIKRNK
jgi:hypothetical protein